MYNIEEYSRYLIANHMYKDYDVVTNDEGRINKTTDGDDFFIHPHGIQYLFNSEKFVAKTVRLKSYDSIRNPNGYEHLLESNSKYTVRVYAITGSMYEVIEKL